ncbi:hypothetical protein CWB98_12445 [Pseudoalteromonas rubra]|uniref:Uncharacterized protein n=1 Tax=Pseudoalteromonas rubra TaxID=43658 RepID=A0A5S3WZ79_9GAMM|nr:hypothetical protein CWB98_12445 [Pseudoalteromonas rubra]
MSFKTCLFQNFYNTAGLLNMTIHYFLMLSFLTYMDSNRHTIARKIVNTKNNPNKQKVNQVIYFKQTKDVINAILRHICTNSRN